MSSYQGWEGAAEISFTNYGVIKIDKKWKIYVMFKLFTRKKIVKVVHHLEFEKSQLILKLFHLK